MKQMDETVASRTERGGNAGRGDGKISWYKIGAVENWLIKGACIQLPALIKEAVRWRE